MKKQERRGRHVTVMNSQTGQGMGTKRERTEGGGTFSLDFKWVGHPFSVGFFVFNVIRHNPLGRFVLSSSAHKGIPTVIHTAY